MNDEQKELIEQIVDKSGLAIDSEIKLRKTLESLSTPWYDSILYKLATAGSIGGMIFIFCALWKIGLLTCLWELLGSLRLYCRRTLRT